MKLSGSLKATLLSIFIGTALTGCVGKGETSLFRTLPESGWLYGDTLEFVTDSVPSGAEASFSIVLVHNDSYPFRNLWIETSYVDRDSGVHVDTVDIQLCDRFGRWLGKGFGDSYQVETTSFPATSVAPASRVTLRHILRVDTLRGIEKVGIDIKPVS